MRKAIANAKIRGPSKLISRVLSKTSTASNSSTKSTQSVTEIASMQINLESEINSLKQQIGKLQIVVNGMQDDTEKKEEAIADLAREKEKLSYDLGKEKRESKKLKQQLDDERHFYYQEKEAYCKEMNNCKKLKKKWLKSKREEELLRELANCRTDSEKIKDTLQKTLEANYNLCVKFLRMKNTKYCLKNRLKKMQSSHDKLKMECQNKIGVLKIEMSEVINNHLKLAIHPSNKRYLQVVKQNGTLLHENMCLQVEVDRLTLELDRIKMMEIRKDTDSKLKFINNKTRTDGCASNIKELVAATTSVEVKKASRRQKENVIDEDLDPREETPKLPTKTSTNNVHFSEPADTVVQKLYERQETEGIPTICILPKECTSKDRTNKEHYNTHNNNTKLAEQKYKVSQKDLEHEKHLNDVEQSKQVATKATERGPSTSVLSPQSPSSIACLQISEVSMKTFFGSARQNKFATSRDSRSDLSECSYYPASEATRTQSAPEIVQSSCFVNQT